MLFNSYTYFNGVYLGAKANGIYKLTGTVDEDKEAADATIVSSITTGTLDLYDSSIERMRQAYIFIQERW